jgi:hypothetical protein
MKTIPQPPRNPCPGFTPSSQEDYNLARTPIKHALTEAQRNWLKSLKK